MAYHYRWPGMIRDALRADARGLWAVAKLAEIGYPNVVKFAEGKASLSLSSAERLCTVLGLTLGNLSRERLTPVAEKPASVPAVRPEPKPLRRTLSPYEIAKRRSLGIPIDD